jgi:hypothetical protein
VDRNVKVFTSLYVNEVVHKKTASLLSLYPMLWILDAF